VQVLRVIAIEWPLKIAHEFRCRTLTFATCSTSLSQLLEVGVGRGTVQNFVVLVSYGEIAQ
jgi:hypothetical protein